MLPPRGARKQAKFGSVEFTMEPSRSAPTADRVFEGRVQIHALNYAGINPVHLTSSSLLDDILVLICAPQKMNGKSTFSSLCFTLMLIVVLTCQAAQEQTALKVRPSSPSNLRVVSSIPPSLFGLTVLNFSNLSPSMSFGTTRSWDAWPNLDWSDANPSRGNYNFAYLDKFVAISQSRGAEIIYTLGRTPRWASSQPNAPTSYGPGECAPPVNMSDYDDYLRAIATHVAGKIRYWELWNEPQDPHSYCGDMATMVTMAQHATQIVKSIDPSALVLSPGVTGGSGPAWLASFLSRGGTANVDVIAFHGYWSATAEDIVNVISNYTTVMAANGASGKPMWDTEGSWAGFGNLGTPSGFNQVGFVAKYYLLQWSQGIERFVWYAYDGGPIWGGLWSADSGESPATRSYKETYHWMVGATLSSPCSQQRRIWTCTLSRPGGYSAEAVWISNANGNFSVPTQYTVYRDLGGAVHTINGNTVTIGDQPILLETTDFDK